MEALPEYNTEVFSKCLEDIAQRYHIENSVFTFAEIDQLGLLRACRVGLMDPLDFDADDVIDMATNGAIHSNYLYHRTS